jgi:hypothetical protein
MMKNFIFISLCLLALASCSTSEEKKSADQDSVKVIAADNSNAASPENSRYKVKSGIITYDSEAMGMKTTSILYWDEFGKNESHETLADMEIMGQKIKTHTLSFNKDGYMVNLDLEKKTGTKTKFTGPVASGDIDYAHLTEDMMKSMNIKKAGTEEVAGKTCDVYLIDYKDMKMKGKSWVWNSLPLKTDVKIGGLDVKQTATKVEENVSVPADKFSIPSDFKVKEM